MEYNIKGFDTRGVDQHLHLAIYRIIQEQLNNILKYAEAKFVTINLNYSSKQITLTSKMMAKDLIRCKKVPGLAL